MGGVKANLVYSIDTDLISGIINEAHPPQNFGGCRLNLLRTYNPEASGLCAHLRRGMIILAENAVRKDESFEAMMRRFKKQIEQEGILRQIRDRQYYETPSERRRKKSRTKGRR